MEIVEDIVIVGAGIAGLATSLGLHRLGLRSLVLESSDCLRSTGSALTVWTNAWRALDALGVGDHLRQHSLRIQGVQIASVESGLPTSELLFGEKYKNLECRCIRRKELLETLEKELLPGTARYSSKVVSIEEAGHVKLLQLADGCVVRTKVVIGCDGVNSAVARWLGLQTPINTGRTAIRGFINCPEGHGFKPEFHVYYGCGVRLGFVPCDDKSLYWFCTFNASDANWHEDMAQDRDNLKKFVLSKTGNIREVSNLLDKTKLDSVSCAALKLRFPWDFFIKKFAKNGILVAGDALHPMTPDIGQGGCSALEDSVVIAKCIGESFFRMQERDLKDAKGDAEIAETLEEGLHKYTKERRWRSCILIVAAYVVGFIQQSDSKVMSFLRERFLSKYSAAATLRMSDFDCGKLIP